jgi:hypothetical protein
MARFARKQTPVLMPPSRLQENHTFCVSSSFFAKKNKERMLFLSRKSLRVSYVFFVVKKKIAARTLSIIVFCWH